MSIAGSIAVALPSQAAWTNSHNVSADGWQATDWPQVSVDRQGDTMFAWEACDASQSSCNHVIQARVRSASGSMGAIKSLSEPGKTVAWPMVDTDDNGDGVVVWEQESQVFGRQVSASGELGPVKRLSVSPTGIELGLSPVVAVGPGGRALVVWTEYGSGYQTVARYFNTDGTLGPVLRLGYGAAEWPAVDVDRDGHAVVAWTDNYERVVARRVKPSGMSAPKTLASSLDSSYARVQVGVDRDGDAVVSWRQARGDDPARLWVREWTRDGSLDPAKGVSPSTSGVSLYHSLAVDLEGDAALAWSRPTGDSGTTVFARTVSRDGVLGPVSQLGAGDRPDATLDDDGDGLVTWHAPGSTRDAAAVVTRPISRTDGIGGTNTTLATDGRVPQVDASPTGRFAVTWQQATSPYRINAAFGP